MTSLLISGRNYYSGAGRNLPWTEQALALLGLILFFAAWYLGARFLAVGDFRHVALVRLRQGSATGLSSQWTPFLLEASADSLLFTEFLTAPSAPNTFTLSISEMTRPHRPVGWDWISTGRRRNVLRVRSGDALIEIAATRGDGSQMASQILGDSANRLE